MQLTRMRKSIKRYRGLKKKREEITTAAALRVVCNRGGCCFLCVCLHFNENAAFIRALKHKHALILAQPNLILIHCERARAPVFVCVFF